MRALLVLGLLTGSFMTAAIACADATPIGRLPKGSTATVVAPRGSLVAVALPRQLESTGLEWRLARRVDPRVLRQVSEANVGRNVVIVFRAIAEGSARVVFALSRGDAGSAAVRAAVYAVRVTSG